MIITLRLSVFRRKNTDKIFIPLSNGLFRKVASDRRNSDSRFVSTLFSTKSGSTTKQAVASTIPKFLVHVMWISICFRCSAPEIERREELCAFSRLGHAITLCYFDVTCVGWVFSESGTLYENGAFYYIARKVMAENAQSRR